MTIHWKPEQWRAHHGLAEPDIPSIPRVVVVRQQKELPESEKRYHAWLNDLMLPKEVLWYMPHPFKLILDGWRQEYWPDVLVCFAHRPKLVIVEVKAMRKGKGHRGNVNDYKPFWESDSREKFKTAAAKFGHIFDFCATAIHPYFLTWAEEWVVRG